MKCIGSRTTLVGFGLLTLLAPLSSARSLDDAHFRATFERRYTALQDVAPDMVVMELRDRVELVASRGSQVGAASNERRVRGFESELLRGLQAASCTSATPSSTARPTPAVIDKVNAAANAQRLRTEPDDVAELSALAQSLLDSQSRERWCALESLDEI